MIIKMLIWIKSLEMCREILKIEMLELIMQSYQRKNILKQYQNTLNCQGLQDTFSNFLEFRYNKNWSIRPLKKS